MKKFFIQFEPEDNNTNSMISFLKLTGDVHEILGTFFFFFLEMNYSSVRLRDSLLEVSENSRVFIMEIPEGVNAAWHLTVDNSNWLKTIL